MMIILQHQSKQTFLPTTCGKIKTEWDYHNLVKEFICRWKDSNPRSKYSKPFYPDDREKLCGRHQTTEFKSSFFSKTFFFQTQRLQKKKMCKTIKDHTSKFRNCVKTKKKVVLRKSFQDECNIFALRFVE